MIARYEHKEFRIIYLQIRPFPTLRDNLLAADVVHCISRTKERQYDEVVRDLKGYSGEQHVLLIIFHKGLPSLLLPLSLLKI